MHTKEEKGPKTHKIQDGSMFTWKFKMAAIFVKIVYVFIDPQMYRSFESIKNLDSIFLKLFVIPGGNALPKKSNGGFFCHPSKSKWEVPRNIPHDLAKLLHGV